MLGKIFHVDILGVAATGVKSQEASFHALDFQAFHQFAAKMETGSGSHHRPLIAGIDTLIIIGILRLHRTSDIFRQRHLAQGI